MTKSADLPLVEYVKDAWRSLEVVKNIHIVKFEYSEDESTININKHIFKRDKKKRKKDRYDFKFVNDDRYAILTVYIQITLDEDNPDSGKKVTKQKLLKKQMLLPLQDEDGYYFIKGKRYRLIYQLVEKSTYTSSSSVTLKSLMPVAVKRNSSFVKTVEASLKENVTSSTTQKHCTTGMELKLPVYNVFVFRKEQPVILFYLANGLDWALGYLGVDEVIKFVPNMNNVDNDRNLYFQISNKCYIEVNKEMFLKYPYIQSIVGGFLHVCTNRITIPDLYDTNLWIKKLSNNNTIEKGDSVLVSFNRMMDETTKKILKLNEFGKNDIYAILRWMMQNYNELRMKDNMNLNNKRLRCNEYIASLLTIEFSNRLSNIMKAGDKATMTDFMDAFKFSGSLLIQKMYSSGILTFDDNINDMDFFSRFKFTIKGPHSLGRKNANNISVRFRGLHPSYLGNIDLLTCGNSDPGTSGILTPFGKIDGLYFDNSKEPNDFEYNFKKDLEKITSDDGYEHIGLKADNKEEYYEALDKILEFNKDIITIERKLKEEQDIIQEEFKDLDSDNPPSPDKKGNDKNDLSKKE